MKSTFRIIREIDMLCYSFRITCKKCLCSDFVWWIVISRKKNCILFVKNNHYFRFRFTVLAISVLEDQSLDNLQLDPSFPLKLRQTQFGRILNKIRLPDQVLRENAYRGLIKSVFFEYKTLHNLLWSAEKYIPREDISGKF